MSQCSGLGVEVLQVGKGGLWWSVRRAGCRTSAGWLGQRRLATATSPTKDGRHKLALLAHIKQLPRAQSICKCIVQITQVVEDLQSESRLRWWEARSIVSRVEWVAVRRPRLCACCHRTITNPQSEFQ